MVATIDVPPDDRFQIITLQTIADHLHRQLAMRRQDVFVGLIDVRKEN